MLGELKGYPVIVFAPEHYNTLGLIRSLGEAGLKPIYISIHSRYTIASYSKYIARIYNVQDIQEGYELLIHKFAVEADKSFIYTIDDKTQAYLDEHYDQLKEKFIFFNCGEANRIINFMDKQKILTAAKDCDIPVLPTRLVKHGTIPKNIKYPIITKSQSPIKGGWKSDVHICKTEDDLKDAYNKIKSPKVLLQKYVDKQNECCLDGFAYNKGKGLFIATEAYYNYNIPGYYSPYMTVKTFDPTDFPISYESIQKLFAMIGFEGVFSMEFILDDSGKYYFSEINFRHSTWSYIATKNGMNLPVEWAESMLNPARIPSVFKLKDNYTAMVEPVDYLKRVIERKYPRLKWIKDLIHTNCKFYWNWKDLKPGIHMLLHNKEFR